MDICRSEAIFVVDRRRFHAAPVLSATQTEMILLRSTGFGVYFAKCHETQPGSEERIFIFYPAIWLSLALFIFVFATVDTLLRVSGLYKLFRLAQMWAVHSETFTSFCWTDNSETKIFRKKPRSQSVKIVVIIMVAKYCYFASFVIGAVLVYNLVYNLEFSFQNVTP